MSTDSSLEIKPLGKSNYPEWSGEMKAYLMRQGTWRLVAKKESKPATTVEATAWELKAEKAAGDIYLFVESDQKVHFRGYEEDPIMMWNLLEQAHLSKKPGAQFNAYDNLFSICKEHDKTLTDMG